MILKKSKKDKLSVTEKISNAANIPFDMAMHLPYTKMYSNREIIIEDAGKLTAYSDECIKVRQKNNVICVCGRELRLLCLVNGDLRVTGFIKSVSFE